MRLLKALPPQKRPQLVRGDSAFGNDPVMTELESIGQMYLTKLRQTAGVKRFGAGIAQVIALLRPWWLIESGARVLVRILWPLHLRPRVGNNTLLLRGPLRLAWPSRDALFRAHGWLAGFALGMAIAETAQSSLTR